MILARHRALVQNDREGNVSTLDDTDRITGIKLHFPELILPIGGVLGRPFSALKNKYFSLKFCAVRIPTAGVMMDVAPITRPGKKA